MNNTDKAFCPWCKCEMKAWETGFTPDNGAYCLCPNCGARGPKATGSTKEEANRNALAAAQERWVEPRKPIDLADVKWLGVPYFAEYKGLDKLFCYVTGSGINADFAAARELGWTGKVLKDLWDWEDERGKLVVRLWECRNSPPTDEERAAAPWEGGSK